MTRISDQLRRQVALAPVSVAASTLTTTAFVDGGEGDEVEFVIATGALGSGKKLTVGIYTSAVAAGTGAVKVAETDFTAAAAMTSALAVASYKVKAAGGRYVGLKIKHDNADAVLIAVTASVRGRYLPAETDWQLMA